MRKIRLQYKMSGDGKEVYMTYSEISEFCIETIEKDYSIKDYDEVSLYNTIVCDLDAEFDDVVADMIDEMVGKVMKKGSE